MCLKEINWTKRKEKNEGQNHWKASKQSNKSTNYKQIIITINNDKIVPKVIMAINERTYNEWLKGNIKTKTNLRCVQIS